MARREALGRGAGVLERGACLAGGVILRYPHLPVGAFSRRADRWNMQDSPARANENATNAQVIGDRESGNHRSRQHYGKRL
jgi:hypothetical protein